MNWKIFCAPFPLTTHTSTDIKTLFITEIRGKILSGVNKLFCILTTINFIVFVKTLVWSMLRNGCEIWILFKKMIFQILEQLRCECGDELLKSVGNKTFRTSYIYLRNMFEIRILGKKRKGRPRRKMIDGMVKITKIIKK